MDKIVFAILASAGSAFAALAPAGIASSDVSHPPRSGVLLTAWRADASPPACRVEMRWKNDYSGKPYLKKVRVCA